MKYAKISTQSNTCLERTEKRKTLLVEGTEISRNEFNCLSAGIEIFICGFTPSDVINKYFPNLQAGDEVNSE